MSTTRRLWISIVFGLCVWGFGTGLYGQSGVYDRVGVIPGHGSHGSLPEENIDLFTGNVTLRYRDVFLPGPNGLDVEVWRVYNSKILKDWQSGQPGVQAYHKSWVGIGWTMHMGMVHQETSSTPVIEFPDGRLETAFLDKNDALNRYITRDFLRYDKTFHELYFQNGVIWKFGATATIYRADGSVDPVRLVTEIKSSYGHKIVIAYNPSTPQIPPTIKTITDSFGRVVTFSSSGTPRKLQSISYKYTSTQYRSINYSVGTFGNGYTKLNEVWPPCLPLTRLEYYDGTYELKKITTSYGGELEYIYDDHGFYFGSTLFNSRVMIQKKIRFNPGEDQFVWNYGYPDYNGVISGDVNVQSPICNASVSYNAYDPANPWKLGTIGSFHHEDGSSTETYDWTFQEISNSHWWLPGRDMGTAKGLLTSSVTRQRLGNSTLMEEFLYDEIPSYKRYGLPWQKRRYINGSESPTGFSTTEYYFWSHPSYEARYLLSLPSCETDFFGDGTLIRKKLTDYYEEDGKWGAKRHVRLLKQGSVSEYNEWTYGYVCNDGTGARIDISVSGPAGSERWTTYMYGVASIQSIGGQENASCTISEFDSSVKSVKLQDVGGSSIVFTYDALGRVILEDWPDDRNDKVTTWPYGENKSITTQGDDTIGHNIVTKFWDGMGRDRGYTEEGDNVTLYFLKTRDAEGRSTAQNTGSTIEEHKINFEYNFRGDIVESTNQNGGVTHIELIGNTKTIRDPNNHVTSFEYDHMPGLPTAVTDDQGHRAVYSYDDLGRLMGVDYNNGARTHSFQYDRADNLLSETHPETGTISYTYNEESWLLDKTWGNVVTHYGYTAESGRLSKIYFGEESNPDEVTYISFDQYNQVTWVRNYVGGQIVWERDADLDRYGNVTSETIALPGLSPKTVTYTYDRNNNPEKITYPDQNWAKIANNGLNTPEKLAFNNDSNLLVNSASYGYNKAPTSLLFARNGTQFTASYDNSGALDTVYLRRGGADLYNADYSYDGAGNVLGIASTAPAEPMSASFVYDELNRLVSATYTTGRVSAFSYEYDPYGNMRSVQENGQPVFSKNYDSQNRIIGDGYDARGNVTSDGTYNYHWDKMNRLLHVTNQFSEVMGQYSYDERGLRFLAMPPLPEIEVFIYTGEVPDEIEEGEEVIFECPVGGPPVQKSFTIKNEGWANLLLDGSPIITIQPNADEFSVVQQPTSPIIPSGTSTFVVEFHPTSPGTKTASISIANNDLSENPFDITLTGNLGPEMDILNIPDGGSWDFGEVEIGQSTESDFVIENTGRGDLLLTGFPKVRINGDEFGQFSVRRQPDSPIPGGGFTYFVIRFSPVNEGRATAEVSIENNDLDENPYTFTISGTGLGGRAGLPDENDIDITEPDGDELIVAGETQTIAWRGGKAAQFVRIEYSIDNGSTYSIIAERAPNTGTFEWTVPPDYSPVCLIRISDADGNPPEPNLFSLEFDLKIRPEAAAVDTTPITIRVAVPDAESQTTHAADLAILYKGREAAEALRLNLAESAPLDLGSFSEKWRHFQVALNKENLSCSVAVDGQPILDAVPLNQLPFIIERPEVDISCQEGSSIKTWLENLELRYQDRVQALAGDEQVLLRSLARDAFDRHAPGIFPQYGGWLLNLLASDGSPLPAGQTAGQIPDQSAAPQGGLMAGIDGSDCLSPTRSFRFEKLDSGFSFTVVKSFAMPAYLPYALSAANFSVISQETKLLQIRERLDAAKKDGAGSSGTDAQEAVTTTARASGVSSMSPLTSTRVGTYYIYTFDGRLLAEYDIYGSCLKEYIYMGSRLVAEYNPSTSQYLYYTQDQISSTRIVTDDTGTVVYAAAHDPYGGIQKVWKDDFDPKRKFSDKERDGETGLDYFGARYYSAPLRWPDAHTSGSYRWLSTDPVLDVDRAIADSQAWNLYSFCGSNPVSYVDPRGSSITIPVPLLYPLKGLLDAIYRARLSLSNLLRGLAVDFDYTNSLEEANYSGGFVKSAWSIKTRIFNKDGKWIVRVEIKVGFTIRILSDGHDWYAAWGKTFKEINIHEANHFTSKILCILDIYKKARILESIEFPAKFLAKAAAWAFERYSYLEVQENHWIENKFGMDFLGLRLYW
ncbi:MAG: choice-of-anchor D domain-containing protein [Candidatus Aminicenantes bacterium]|nr:choice-of-anchor D domain-containing protein [Candidatus Aminicenantes bacterium]